MICFTLGLIPSPSFGIEYVNDGEEWQFMIFLFFIVLSVAWKRWEYSEEN